MLRPSPGPHLHFLHHLLAKGADLGGAGKCHELPALILAAHSIEAAAASTGPCLFTTWAPVQVRLRGDGEAQVSWGDPTNSDPESGSLGYTTCSPPTPAQLPKSPSQPMCSVEDPPHVPGLEKWGPKKSPDPHSLGTWDPENPTFLPEAPSSRVQPRRNSASL